MPSQVPLRGELPRSELPALLGTGARPEMTRATLHLAFRAALASRRMPGLFSERTT